MHEKGGFCLKTAAIILAIVILLGVAAISFAPEKEISAPAEESLPAKAPVEIPEEPEPTEIEFSEPLLISPENTLRAYFSALYDSYIATLPVDISPIIAREFEMMENVLNWNTLLQLRRSVIAEKKYCFVERERFDYSIEFIRERDLDDQRMDYVDTSGFEGEVFFLHFVIKGEEGKAYPPIFALNSQHTVAIIRDDEEFQYKIAYHYFPGSEGKFQNDLPVETMSREEMEKLLEKEFSGEGQIEETPVYDKIYDPEAAAAYAAEFCEERNPDFHFVGDWYGNCMNFVSQSVWAGFREAGDSPKNLGSMTKKWYCKKSGGTLIWASVSRFYGWAFSEEGKMQCTESRDASAMKKGDIVHIGSYACEEEEKFTHALLVVDEEKALLAQNSPACFVYYSDLANNYSRFITPVSLDS